MIKATRCFESITLCCEQSHGLLAQFTKNPPIFSLDICMSSCSWALWKVSWKFHWDRSWSRNLLLLTDRRWFRTIAYITPKNIRWGHWVHATFRRVNNRVALRATYEFLCAIRERVEWRSPREFRDYLHTSYRRDIFATGICIRLRAISRSRWRAPEGWNQKWGWLKLHFLPIAVLPSA